MLARKYRQPFLLSADEKVKFPKSETEFWKMFNEAWYRSTYRAGATLYIGVDGLHDLELASANSIDLSADAQSFTSPEKRRRANSAAPRILFYLSDGYYYFQGVYMKDEESSEGAAVFRRISKIYKAD